MSKTDNERIHEWLGNYWHEHNGESKCVKCGDRRPSEGYVGMQPHRYFDWRLPKYNTDPAAAIALLEAVRAKGYSYLISTYESDAPYRPANQYCLLSHYPNGELVQADTLPAAIAKAVIALIEAESGETK